MNAVKESKPRRKKKTGPAESSVLAYLAATFLKYGSPEKARALYALLAQLQPKERRFRLALGYASLRCGRAEEALAHLEAAFRGRGPTMEAWEALLLERTLRANGMVEESRNLMRRIIAAGNEA
jgi:tetratricopeptide (TPR) repeat protein